MLPVNADTCDKPEIDVSPGSMHPAICKLRYGAIDYPPNWFRDKVSGKWTGFLVGMLEDIAKEMGAEAVPVETTWAVASTFNPTRSTCSSGWAEDGVSSDADEPHAVVSCRLSDGSRQARGLGQISAARTGGGASDGLDHGDKLG